VVEAWKTFKEYPKENSMALHLLRFLKFAIKKSSNLNFDLSTVPKETSKNSTVRKIVVSPLQTALGVLISKS